MADDWLLFVVPLSAGMCCGPSALMWTFSGLPRLSRCVKSPTSASISLSLNCVGDSLGAAPRCLYSVWALLMAMSTRNQARRGHQRLVLRPMRA